MWWWEKKQWKKPFIVNVSNSYAEGTRAPLSICTHYFPISLLKDIQYLQLLNYSMCLQVPNLHHLPARDADWTLSFQRLLVTSHLCIAPTLNGELLLSQAAASRWKYRIDHAPRWELFWQLASQFLQAAGTYHWHLAEHYPTGAECHPVLYAGNNQEHVLS